MAIRITLLALSGGLGTVARYLVNVLMSSRLSLAPAYGTFTVNLVGCFLFGFAWSHMAQKEMQHANISLVIFTGFLGAFTTFSALLFDTSQLAKSNQFITAASNLGGQLVLGALLLALGMAVGQRT